jgi:hypothetical protein
LISFKEVKEEKKRECPVYITVYENKTKNKLIMKKEKKVKELMGFEDTNCLCVKKRQTCVGS